MNGKSFRSALILHPLWYLQILYFCAFISVWAYFLFSSPLTLDYSEGELLDHVFHWIADGKLYTNFDQVPYKVLNYPPLYLYLARGIHELSHLSILNSGRLLNMSAFFLITYCFLRWDNKIHLLKRLAYFSLLSTSFSFLYSLTKFQLELPAAALSFFSVYLLRKELSHKRVFLAALTFGLACYVKQTQVVYCIVATFYFLLKERKFLLTFFLPLLLLACAGAYYFHQVYGETFWQHILVYTVGAFSFEQLYLELISHVLPWFIFILVLLSFLKKQGQTFLGTLLYWCFISASIWLLASARLGSGYQYFIDWSLFFVLYLSFYFSNESNSCSKWRSSFIFMQVLGANLIVGMILWGHLQNLHEKNLHIEALCETIKPLKGEILSEEAQILNYCGRQTIFHPFIMSSLISQGIWDGKDLINLIESNMISAIILPTSLEKKKSYSKTFMERWHPQLLHPMRSRVQRIQKLGPWYIHFFGPAKSQEVGEDKGA